MDVPAHVGRYDLVFELSCNVEVLGIRGPHTCSLSPAAPTAGGSNVLHTCSNW